MFLQFPRQVHHSDRRLPRAAFVRKERTADRGELCSPHDGVLELALAREVLVGEEKDVFPRVHLRSEKHRRVSPYLEFSIIIRVC